MDLLRFISQLLAGQCSIVALTFAHTSSQGSDDVKLYVVATLEAAKLVEAKDGGVVITVSVVVSSVLDSIVLTVVD